MLRVCEVSWAERYGELSIPASARIGVCLRHLFDRPVVVLVALIIFAVCFLVAAGVAVADPPYTSCEHITLPAAGGKCE